VEERPCDPVAGIVHEYQVAGMTASALPARFTQRRRSVMLKMSILIGTPSAITYLASTSSQHMDSILYIFVLSIASLLVAILSHINEKSRP
jgi:hypothetical protein